MTHQAIVIAFCVMCLGAAMIAIEGVRAGRRFPKVTGWYARAIAINAFQVGAVYLAGLVWNGWMISRRPWSADGLGTVAGALLGYLCLTFVYYSWHLWRHRSEFLWRWLHQIHHSAQRLEVLTAFYKHPIEILIDSVLSSAVVYLVIGLGPAAGAGAMMLSGIGELFYHWNVGTPHWLGFIFQRPESHLVHHEEGLHDYNYSDLPLWDIMFGTFRNPREWNHRCGLGERNEHRLGEMLLGIDVWRSSQRLGAAPAERIQVCHESDPRPALWASERDNRSARRTLS
jgi:sterol desaturase/sphingolipid hydroxylase (fatty acid hydroxylase superfamily)